MALNEEQIDKVKGLLASSAWNDVVKPILTLRANSAIKALILSPAEREGDLKDLDDSTLRARIRECEWMLSAFANEVAVFDHNRRMDELQRQADPDGSEPSTANP
jgi:hypothetical protein